MEELIVKNRQIKEQIVGIINNSGLPAFMLKNILKDCFEQLTEFETKEYNEAMKKLQAKQEQRKQEEEKKNKKKNNKEV